MQNDTRAEHLAWCKERALEYLPGDPQMAVTSFLSDLSKHEETKDHLAKQLIFGEMMLGPLTADRARRLIEGTN